MKPRIPLIVTVVGALLVGGATTGGTNASWVSQKPLGASRVTAGSMSSGGTASPSALTVNRAASGTVDVLVSDSSAGKNMMQRVTPSVTATVGTATLVTKAGGACTTTAQSAVDLAPAASFTTCVRYTAPDSTASSATITVTLTGRQVRAGNLAGWSAAPTLTIPVTINQPQQPVTPTITCGSFQSNGVFSFGWTDRSGESYTVHRSTTTNADASYSVVTTSASTPYQATVAEGTSYWRVKSATTTSSGFSNTLRLVRNGNGSNSIVCTPVTP